MKAKIAKLTASPSSPAVPVKVISLSLLGLDPFVFLSYSSYSVILFSAIFSLGKRFRVSAGSERSGSSVSVINSDFQILAVILISSNWIYRKISVGFFLDSVRMGCNQYLKSSKNIYFKS